MVKRVVKERMRTLRTGTYNRLKAKGLRLKATLFSLPPSALGLKKGFTLIELIVVIFIVSLFLAISVPSFTGIESNEIRAEAKMIASILRYLNDSSTNKKEELYLTVNFNDRTITYSAEEGDKKETVKYLRSLFLESKGDINIGEVKVIFTPFGAREFMRFNLRAGQEAGSRSFTVELNPLSGRVKIGEGVKG